MKLRPCIDIHNGKVKQIVGSSLQDAGDKATDNFVSDRDGAYYARLYQEKGLTGGHAILLNAKDSEYYEATKAQAMLALSTVPGLLEVGGGITADNAREFIEAGASHVIVTSFVFTDGVIKYDRLQALVDAVGREHVVLDLSCRKKDGNYYVVTDRWQTFTDEVVDGALFDKLSEYCDEFLVHGVDVEGKKAGIDQELIKILSTAAEKHTITYAGGISTMEDIELIHKASSGRLDITIGSALDTFGGALKMDDVIKQIEEFSSLFQRT